MLDDGRPINKEFLERKSRVYTTGSIGEIYKLFILPLERYCPASAGLARFKEMLFNTDFRTVDFYTARVEIEVSGKRQIAKNSKKPRPVLAPGELVLVRRDTRDDFVDLQVLRDPSGAQEDYFRMSIVEWNILRPYLERRPDSPPKYNYLKKWKSE